MHLIDNIRALRAQACETDAENLKDVKFLAKRAYEDEDDLLDKDSWGRWDSWNDWGAAS